MTSVDITNKNFLSQINFKFVLKRAPYVDFFVQSVNLPGISLPPVDVNNPLIRIPYPGDHLNYEELELSFKVDEDFQNYFEIHNWIRNLGKRDFNEYKSISSNPDYSGDGIRSDISLFALTSQKNPNYEIVFKDAFPISLSGLEFRSTDESVDYIEAKAVFNYITYDINKTT